MRRYRREHPEYGKGRITYDRYDTIEVKTQTLSRYGKEGRAQCCWDGCQIDDVDMLSLDHVADNGAKHRREMVSGTGGKYRCDGGVNLYRLLRRTGFPEGFQTLCHNHQWKKEILRRRRIRIETK